MKILIVTQYFWPENFRINDIALRLKEKGHDVGVLTGLPNYPSGKIFPGWGPFKRLNEVWEGILIKRFPHFPRGNRKALGMAANFLSFALVGCLAAPFLIRCSYDVIFVYEPSPVTVGLPAIVLKKLKKCPIVFWVQDLWPETFEMVSGIKNRWIQNCVAGISSFIHRQSDRVLVASKSFIPLLKKQGVAPEVLFYYPQTAEGFYKPLDTGSGEAVKESLPEGFRIMFAGNIGVSQSVETIINAASLTKEEPAIKWVIIGDGREFEKVQSMVKEKGLENCVHLLGRKPAEDMPSYFALADVLLLTLKSDPIFAMTVPAKLQSYMACGKPILASVNGEASEIIAEAQAGLSVPAEDAESLANAALKMFSSKKGKLEEWSQNSLAYYRQKFSTEKAMVDLEQHLLKARQLFLQEGEK